jgi:hypothetical protein
MRSQRTKSPRSSVRRRVIVASALAVALPLGVAPSVLVAPAGAAVASSQLSWSTVVNLSDLAPGSTKYFNSFNQPSVNTDGVVAFRARTKGESEPVRGVYTRDATVAGSPIATVAAVGDAVPAPNNAAGKFNEFPAFPRIDATGPMVATRGQSTPVWTLADGTKVGTSGVYATSSGTLTSGATLLGTVPGYEMYTVPDAPAGTRFDQFPGAPAVDGSTIVFKGNYTVGTTGLTGDYFRDLSKPDQPVGLIAGATTRIPNQPAGGTAVFGSTAPPSAAGGKTVFSAWDNEETPTMGGIYLADTTPSPSLTTIVGIGDQVPGQTSADRFTNVGEGLSFDGRFLGFWASWGSETRPIVLTCPTDGNKDLVAFCLQQYPNGFTTSVPLHQGIFVADIVTHEIHAVTASGPRFTGFQYWVFSGRPPGTGGGEEDTLEPARWRSSAFVAVTGLDAGAYQVAFKASPVSGGSGIYVGQGPSAQERIVAAFDTSTPGPAIDPKAPAGSVVSALGVERDGFRGRYLAVNASMLDPVSSESWAGIYVTRVPLDLAVQPQAITITSTPPADAMAGGTYVIGAMADSGLPVSFSVASSTTNEACSVTGTTVHFDHAGTCVVNADQPGDAAYSPAPRVQQSIVVTTATTTVSVVTAVASTVFGQETTATATVSAAVGSAVGVVAFAIDGAALGAPVTVTGGKATSQVLLGSGGKPLVPGSHEVTAVFTPTDVTVYGGSQGSVSHVVGLAGTTVKLVVGATTLTATVLPVAPGVGTITGAVVFTVGGAKVGQATLQDGVATLDHVVAPGMTQRVAATYAGDTHFTGSSASTSRYDPKITATVTSAYARTRYGWYRSAVTVTFRCVTQGAPLAAPCPAPVRLTRSGGGQSVTRTIVATDGGVATVVVRMINIDLVRPTVRIDRVRNGAVYFGVAPAPRCIARDALSGVASCRITTRTVGDRVSYRATATDRAGNTAAVVGTYRILRIYVQGAKYVNGTFQLRAGQRYAVIVYSATRPTYYYAAVAPRVPSVRDHSLYRAGYHRWAIGVRVTSGMRNHNYWNLGVRIGSSMKLIRIHVV